MRTLFKIALVAAWLCVVGIGISPLSDVASVAESTFIFVILWVWIAAWATATIPRHAWLAAPPAARIVLLSSLMVVAVTVLIVLVPTSRPASAGLSGARDVSFVLLAISGLTTPVCVITAYARRSLRE